MKRSPRNVKISFSGKRLTHFGGLYLLQRFFQKINLRSLLSQYLHFLQRNNRYAVAEEMLTLIYPISLGLGRIETSYLLKQNGVFQYLTGLPTYPNPTTLRRFLLRMAPIALPKLRKLHDRLLLSMILRPKPPIRVIFDLDSTVLTLYGKQEMARIGFCPVPRFAPPLRPDRSRSDSLLHDLSPSLKSVKEGPDWRSRTLPVGFWLAIGVGMVLRVWYFADLVQQPWFGYPLVDSLTFDRTAREILAQGHPAAYFRPPLYPYFLAGLYAVVGRNFAVVAAVQGLLGLAALYPAYRLGERWFGRAAALGGAWVGACYPLRIFFEGELLDSTLFSFLLLWGLWMLWRGLELERGALLALLLSGLLLGAAALARLNVLIALPFVALGAVLSFRRAGRVRPVTAGARFRSLSQTIKWL